MSVNGNRLETLRDNAFKSLPTDPLMSGVLTQGLNALVHIVRNDDLSLDEINTLTEAGRIICNHYGKN